MILRRWDPGVGKEECSGRNNNGEWYRRSSPDLVVMGEGNLGILRKDRIMSDLGQISIIINTKSQISDEVVSDVVGYSMKGLMHETGGEPKDIGSYICFELGLLVHGHRWDNDNTFYLYYFVVVSGYLSRLLTSGFFKIRFQGGQLGLVDFVEAAEVFGFRLVEWFEVQGIFWSLDQRH
ncbi:hypothetical protein Bca52824_054352 [Brassica carinata]|uniref:Uncharacterized protein n=1 Tax=Brassica carinata TaxID=52824 RepID=A0A8X7R7P8_BRACI|nr:hypothetical protein Bca52824_054352 [Brassica carinata]